MTAMKGAAVPDDLEFGRWGITARGFGRRLEEREMEEEEKWWVEQAVQMGPGPECVGRGRKVRPCLNV